MAETIKDDRVIEERCIAAVYVRDTYRRTGRGKSGYEMHYTRKRCARKAVTNGRCWQHQDESFMPWPF